MIFDLVPRYTSGILCLAVLACTPNTSAEQWKEREKFESLRSDEFGLIVYPSAASFKEGDISTWRVKGRLTDLPRGFFDFRICEVTRTSGDYHFAATVDFSNGHIVILRSGEIVDYSTKGEIPSSQMFAYTDEATAYQVRAFLVSISGVHQSQEFENLKATQKKCLVKPEQ